MKFALALSALAVASTLKTDAQVGLALSVDETDEGLLA
jgi:hypothetical protein